MDPSSSDTVRQRRSTRVDFRCRAVLSGNDSNGQPFRVEADTLEVSLHGARIRCNAPLQVGMQLRITIPGRNQTQLARVVWERITGEHEFGIELHAPSSFWGIGFGPAKPKPKTAEKSRGALLKPEVENSLSNAAPEPEKPAGPEPPSLPDKKIQASSSQAAPLLAIPQNGISVLVSGISIARTAFQETAILRPQGDKQVSLTMNRIVDTGAMLRVTFPATNRAMLVRVSEVACSRQANNCEVSAELLGNLKA